MVRLLLEVVFLIGTVGGLGYYVLCLWSAFRFLQFERRFHSNVRELAPPASILKPLKGADREIYASFRSHCLQNYGEYEIIFGVNDLEGTVVREKIYHEAGAHTAQAMTLDAILKLIRGARRVPAERDSFYNILRTSFDDAPAPAPAAA